MKSSSGNLRKTHLAHALLFISTLVISPVMSIASVSAEEFNQTATEWKTDAGNSIFSASTLNQIWNFIFDQSYLKSQAPDGSKPEQSRIRTLWWNVQKGETNRILAKVYGTKPPLDVNLQKLIANEATRPEILALGEYTDNSLSPETLQLIHQVYSFVEITHYNSEATMISILFATRLKVVHTTQLPLDYVPITESNVFSTNPNVDPNESSADSAYRARWNQILGPEETLFSRRQFQAYLLELPNGSQITVVPVHLMEPWVAIKRLFGKLKTAYQIFIDNDNPLIEQVKRLILYATVEQRKNQTPLLMLGDFNLPKGSLRSAYVNSIGYDLIEHFFTDLFQDDLTATFPTPSSQLFHEQESDSPWVTQPTTDDHQMPPLKLDHAFLLGGLFHSYARQTYSPRLMGSDHFPIWVQFQLR